MEPILLEFIFYKEHIKSVSILQPSLCSTLIKENGTLDTHMFQEKG